MKDYTAIEKQQIMLKSDLLNHSLSLDELDLLHGISVDKLEDSEQLSSLKASDDLKNKIKNLLGQGMKLSLELEKLAQRGIEIIFPDQQKVSDHILEQFVRVPALLYMIGNRNYLLDENISIVTSYSDFRKSTNPVVFIPDQKLDTFLRYPDISRRLMDGTVLLVSDAYRNRANLKKASSQEKRMHKKVFISGSRSQNDIPENVQKSLELIRKQRIEILIGDSEKGVDNQIIDYLRVNPKYSAVEIFTIKQKPRVKVEDEWKTKTVQANSDLKPQEKQMVKDRAMADAADWGLAIFKPITKNRYGAIQVSAGTLRNTIQLLLNKKAVKFFYVFENEVAVENLKTISELSLLLERYKAEKLTDLEREEILSSKGVEKTSDAAFVKYTKIKKKFEELLKSEEKLLETPSSFKSNNKQISLFG
jgi:hypothetical protein